MYFIANVNFSSMLATVDFVLFFRPETGCELYSNLPTRQVVLRFGDVSCLSMLVQDTAECLESLRARPSQPSRLWSLSSSILYYTSFGAVLCFPESTKFVNFRVKKCFFLTIKYFQYSRSDRKATCSILQTSKKLYFPQILGSRAIFSSKSGMLVLRLWRTDEQRP